MILFSVTGRWAFYSRTYESNSYIIDHYSQLTKLTSYITIETIVCVDLIILVYILLANLGGLLSTKSALISNQKFYYIVFCVLVHNVYTKRV